MVEKLATEVRLPLLGVVCVIKMGLAYSGTHRSYQSKYDYE